jgi:23S rRNA (cytosine1962-C5)-methyltransferase
MAPLVAKDWRDYELLDAGGGERLERWGAHTLRRPDPQVLWPRAAGAADWDRADARYHRSASGGGRWQFARALPERWVVRYEQLAFYVRPTGFKHTGLFPEQAVNWAWMGERIRAAGRPISVLNLFAYTGAATVAAAAAGASVCHVDSAKGMVAWAKENAALSGLADRPVRFLVDDVLKFVQRERRRGHTYDAIVMDPPSYGRGTSGETWKIEKALVPLVTACVEVLSPSPLFFLINSYTTGLSPTVLANVLATTAGARRGGETSSGEVALPIAASRLLLPCGIFARWEAP